MPNGNRIIAVTSIAMIVFAAIGLVSCGASRQAGDASAIELGDLDGGESTIGGSISNRRNDLCATANVQASRIKPSVLFVVDRSYSTSEAYPGSTNRWQAMYDALMDPNVGVIKKLEAVVYFGMVLYDSGDDPASCPRLITVDPNINNYNAIAAKYNFQNAGPGRYTPTALALEAAYRLVPDQQKLDIDIGAEYVILCTDGEPNGCSATNGSGFLGGLWGGIPPTDYEGPVAQVTAAASNGIKTYVIGIAVSGEAQNHLEDLARLGNTGASAFSPTNKDALVDLLSQLVGGAIGCEVLLNGDVAEGKECTGYVELNSEKLPCNDANGWRLVGKNHIELQGTACKKFMNDPKAILNAGFPCDVITIY